MYAPKSFPTHKTNSQRDREMLTQTAQLLLEVTHLLTTEASGLLDLCILFTWQIPTPAFSFENSVLLLIAFLCYMHVFL